MSGERIARLIVILLALGLPIAAVIARSNTSAIEMHGAIAESGGWTPGNLTASVGVPLRLRLTSDDVIHGFAIGQSDVPAVDVKPGQMSDVTLTFDEPGKYTYYCTRWCGPNHWRMRGSIEVSGPASAAVPESQPLYVTLGIDLDAPHPADVIPDRRPAAARGSSFSAAIPSKYLSTDYYRTHSPVEAWKALRAEPSLRGLTDPDVWDAVAFIWRSHTTPDALAEARKLFAANCAACHGETGAGDGVMADSLGGRSMQPGGAPAKPANFTDAASLLGASPALLQGKIVRGGMGTSMPYWGPIFTEAQTWALVDYLWTFQFQGGEEK